VSAQEVVEAVYQQTGRSLDAAALVLPDIKAVGTYEVSVKLHPDVTGTFSVVVQREKQITIKKK
jgi:large subunit ribosomal protein L9